VDQVSLVLLRCRSLPRSRNHSPGQDPVHLDGVRSNENCSRRRPGPSDRESFGLPSNVPLALFVGDIRTPRKNLDTVLRALQQTPEIHLAVAGGVKDSPYPALARELGVNERVFFLNKVSRISSLMRSVDLFVFPSRYEAHPLVVLEAMASGLPAIVSGSFGAEGFLGDGGHILKDPNDVAALAAVINGLMQAPEKRRSMALAGRERALEMRWSTMAAAYLDVYEKLLQSRIEEGDLPEVSGTVSRRAGNME
jgi:glycosyltransferase involved in cell wall biosynthesis